MSVRGGDTSVRGGEKRKCGAQGKISSLIVSYWELGNKLGRNSYWMWMPSYPLYSGKISQESLS